MPARSQLLSFTSAVFACVALSAPLRAQVEQIGPRPSGTPSEVVPSGAEPNRVLLADPGGVATSIGVSTDGGLNFESRPINVLPPDLLFDVGSDASGRFYARTGSAVWSSADGLDWTERPFGATVTGNALQLEVAAAATDQLWLLTTAGLFISLDGGLTWVQAPAGPGVVYGNSSALALDPKDPLRAVVIGGDLRLRSTTDGGSTWTVSTVSGPLGSQRRLAVDGSAVVLSALPAVGGALHRTVDGGFTWSVVVPGVRITDLAVDPIEAGRIVGTASTGNHVALESLDSGATWAPLAGYPERDALAGDTGDYVSIARVGTRRTFVVLPLTGTLSQGAAGGPAILSNGPESGVRRFSSVDFDPSDRAHIVACADGLALETDDEGETWSLMDVPAGVRIGSEIRCRELGTVFLAGRDTNDEVALWQRENGLWSRLQLPSTGTAIAIVNSLEVTEVAPYGFAIAYDRAAAGAAADQILGSFDGGTTWSSMNTQPSVEELLILEGTPGPRLVWSSLEVTFATPFDSQVSYADGISGSFTVLNASQLEATIAKSRSSQGTVIAAFARVAPPLESTDGFGTTSTFSPPFFAHALGVGSADADLLVRIEGGFGMDSQFLVSRDRGTSWQLLGTSVSLDEFVTRARLVLRPDDTEGLYANETAGLLRFHLADVVGESICGPAVSNSRGLDARLSANGSLSLSENELRLHARFLPTSATSLLVVSQDTGFVPNPGGSLGNLCLGGQIGRFVRQIQDSSVVGEANFTVDTTALPLPGTAVAAQAGERWNFQVWYQDLSAGQQGSNFTDAVAVTFVP